MSGMHDMGSYRTNNANNATTGARFHAAPPSNSRLMSGIQTESRYSNVDTNDGLTYSASAVSDTSELIDNQSHSSITNRFIDIVPN